MRPELPLRNTAGDVVDEAQWKEEYAAEGKDLWKRPISSWAAGRYPDYCDGEKTVVLDDGPASVLRAELNKEAIPSEDWIRSICKDVRELTIGCGIHVCSASDKNRMGFPPGKSQRSADTTTTTGSLSSQRMNSMRGRCAGAGNRYVAASVSSVRQSTAWQAALSPSNCTHGKRPPTMPPR